jgi:5-(carboxyamino)imidazole ribonucleotide mutase
MKKVAIIMGSDSDLPVVAPAIKQLKELGIEVEARVMSAHRTPEEAHEFSKNAIKNGFGVIIAAAGMAAHLGGVRRQLLFRLSVFRAVQRYSTEWMRCLQQL